MKFIIQRVSRASVTVRQREIASIDKGLLVLVGIKRGDTQHEANWLIKKTLQMRIFDDTDGKMNDSVTDVAGALLFVPNFTLYADASQGNRPGFTNAEEPGKARQLYNKMIETAGNRTDLKVETGEFGAYMDVSLVNDGPVTVVLEK